MTELTHADAHERLADLVLEPVALERLMHELAPPTPAADARQTGDRGPDQLTAHVLGCPICRDEVVAWERLHSTVRTALGGRDHAGGALTAPVRLADLVDEERIDAPAELRASVRELARTARPPRSVPTGWLRSADRPSTSPFRHGLARVAGRLLPLAAVLVVAIVAGGALLDQAAHLDRSRAETAALETVAATVDRVLRDPAHRVVELRDSTGVARGSISWSRQDLVVLTNALVPPPAGQLYRCWIERGGVRYPVGQMWFAGGTAYWTGSVDAWAATSFDAGGTFGVSLEAVAGSAVNPAVLVADLGS